MLHGASLYRYICFILMCHCFSQAALAEKLDSQKSPVAIPIGHFELVPLMEVGETYNDNIFRRNNIKKASFLTQIHAGGQIALKRQLNHYALTYLLQSSQYHSSPQDDYVDHFIGVTSHTEFTQRNRLDLDFKFLDSHYQRGNFLGRDLLGPTSTFSSPDQYHSYGGSASYRYGRIAAKGNLELKVNFEDITFDNNLARTAVWDRTRIDVAPGFYLRLFQKTTLQLQIENSLSMFKHAEASSYDNYKQRFLVGGTWAYSQKTQAMLRFGYLRQFYDNTAIPAYDDLTWDMNLKWALASYSQLNLNVARDVNASLASYNLRASDRVKLDWSTNWSEHFSSQVFGAYENANNIAIHRQDEYLSLGFDINYGFRRWLGFGINYTYRNLKSADQTLDFDQSTLLIYATANPRSSDNVNSPWSSWY